MNHTKVVSPNSELKLPKGLDKRHTLYVSNSSSQLKRQHKQILWVTNMQHLISPPSCSITTNRILLQIWSTCRRTIICTCSGQRWAARSSQRKKNLLQNTCIISVFLTLLWTILRHVMQTAPPCSAPSSLFQKIAFWRLSIVKWSP